MPTGVWNRVWCVQGQGRHPRAAATTLQLLGGAEALGGRPGGRLHTSAQICCPALPPLLPAQTLLIDRIDRMTHEVRKHSSGHYIRAYVPLDIANPGEHFLEP